MPRSIYFITHPDVLIDPKVPVPRWPLSARGRERMQRLAWQPWARQLTLIYCSEEQKAIDGATILATAIGAPVRAFAALAENDRSSTGYLPKTEFEAMADAFFARPNESVRGWERAIDAQHRIVTAIDTIVAASPSDGPIGIVAHGGVGALLLGHLKREPISRVHDQPSGSGGNYFLFTMPDRQLVHTWRSIDG
jgi:broad specificity phosphatase PhoE